MIATCRVVALGAACLVGSACQGEVDGEREAATGFFSAYDFSADPVQWHLPDRLREISGLARASDGRLFGHDDERAIVYEIDARSGALVKAFALGDGGVRGDFEGIAWVDGTVYLIDSAGRLLRGPEGGDGETVAHETLATGLAAECEVEGLAYDAPRRLLLIACKATHATELAGRVAVFAWRLADERLDAAASFTTDESAIATRLGTRRFNPSAIELTGEGTHVLLLAGRQRSLVALDAAGNVVDAVRLPKRRHPQPEGLALDATGALLIADEGRKGRGRLAIYERSR